MIEMVGSTGATMINVSKGKFENLKLIKPSDNLIEDFSSKTKPVFVQIWNLMEQHQRLKECIVKGFALDDERMKAAGQIRYFDELQERIRDIRSSERIFYQKVKDIFTLSKDYDAQTSQAKEFFATIQNKLHWAIHQHTAAELIAGRANASEKNMGLTSWQGAKIRKTDWYKDEVAKLTVLKFVKQELNKDLPDSYLPSVFEETCSKVIEHLQKLEEMGRRWAA